MKSKPILLYSLLFVISVIVFLFVLFPQQQLAQVLSQALTDPEAGIYTSIDTVKPSLPFDLALSNTTVSFGQRTRIAPETVNIKIGPRLFFGEKRQIRFKSKIHDGQVKGRVEFLPSQPVVYTNAQLSLDGLTFDQFQYNTRMARMKLSGSLDAQFSYLPQKEGQKDPGHGTVLIKEFTAVLKNSFFNTLKLPKIDFKSVNVEFTQERENINITRLEAQGSVINLKINGIVKLAFPLAESRLSLTGQVLPDSPYLANFANSANIRSVIKNIKKDGIRFRVNGTLKQPRIEI